MGNERDKAEQPIKQEASFFPSPSSGPLDRCECREFSFALLHHDDERSVLRPDQLSSPAKIEIVNHVGNSSTAKDGISAFRSFFFYVGV